MAMAKRVSKLKMPTTLLSPSDVHPQTLDVVRTRAESGFDVIVDDAAKSTDHRGCVWRAVTTQVGTTG